MSGERPGDIRSMPETNAGQHVFFVLTVPADIAAAGQGLGACKAACKGKKLRFLDATRIGKDGRTWKVKATALVQADDEAEEPQS